MLYYFTQPKAQIKTANKVVGNLIFEMRAALEMCPSVVPLLVEQRQIPLFLFLVMLPAVFPCKGFLLL